MRKTCTTLQVIERRGPGTYLQRERALAGPKVLRQMFFGIKNTGRIFVEEFKLKSHAGCGDGCPAGVKQTTTDVERLWQSLGRREGGPKREDKECPQELSRFI